MRRFASVRKDWLCCRRLVRIGLALLSAQIIAVGRTQAAENGFVVFDLPRQPLSQALEAYSAATGRPLLYDGHLAIGRFSTELKGNFAPDIALQLILKNTGLVAWYIAQDAFTIAPATTQMPVGRAP